MAAEQPPTFPIARTCPHAPREEHVQVREGEPVRRVTLPTGSPAWVVTRHEDVRALLADTRFSSDGSLPGFPLRGSGGETGDAARLPMMLNMDPPEHGPARRAVLGEFTVRRIAALKPRVQQIVDEHIDAMLEGPKPVDLVQALSLPVPSLVICDLLGVPYEDHDFFQERSGILVRHNKTPQEQQEALHDLVGYLDALLRAKEKDPGDDLLSRQIHRHLRDHGEVDRGDLLGLSFLLLVAGHETTANMISLSVLKLSQEPGLGDTLLRDPDRTLPAVEELLRYFTIAEQALVRVATTDIELGGKVIRAGEGVLALAHTANRDPRAFEAPDLFDIERGARNHLSFGYGPHQCLGQNLARVELRIVLDTLVRRLPGIRSAVPVEELPFKDDGLIYGIHEFPVTW